MNKKLISTIEALIKNDPCVISSIDNNGYPIIRAMLNPRKVEDYKYFYFSTNTSSNKVEQYRNNNKACIYFANFKGYEGLTLKGTMEVLEDQSIKDDIWNFGDRIYYKKGKTDPDYCVLKFRAESGNFYKGLKVIDFKIDDLIV